MRRVHITPAVLRRIGEKAVHLPPGNPMGFSDWESSTRLVVVSGDRCRGHGETLALGRQRSPGTLGRRDWTGLDWDGMGWTGLLVLFEQPVQPYAILRLRDARHIDQQGAVSA